MQYSCIFDTDFKVQNKNWEENHMTHNGDHRIYMLIFKKFGPYFLTISNILDKSRHTGLFQKKQLPKQL